MINLQVVLSFAAVAFAYPSPDVSHLQGQDSHHHRDAYTYNPPASGYTYQSPPSQEVIERQNVYYLAAEDRPQDQHLRVTYIPGPTLRSNNVVFVKAPQLVAPLPNIVVPTPQNEQKTLVYVLQKTPEQPADIHLQPHQQEPATHKPEVLFVKYADDHDAHVKIATGLQGGSVKNLYGAQDVGSQDGLIQYIRNNDYQSQIHVQHQHHEHVAPTTQAPLPPSTVVVPSVLYGAVPPTPIVN